MSKIWSFSSPILLVLALCFLSPIYTYAAGPIVPPPSLVTCLKKALSPSSPVFPTSPTYNTARQNLLFNLEFSSQYPLAIVKPTVSTEIASALACARAASWRAVARNGGHSFEASSAQNGTIVIDLTLMNNITFVNGTGGSTYAVVQSGATLGAVYYHAYYSAGKGLNAGTCPPVGVSGLMSGGGYGYWSRANGLGCDNVVSFTMVTYDGKTLASVNATGPFKDLFWATCGGGGGNFGIVLSWVIKLFDIPSTVQYGSLKFGTDTATSVALWSHFQTWAPAADPQLGMELNFGSGNPSPRLLMYYTGDGSLQALVAASGLLNLTASPVTQNYNRVSYITAVQQSAGWGLKSPQDLLNTDWSTFRTARVENSFYILTPMTSALIQQVFALQQKYSNSSIKLHPYGGVIAQKSASATAFPWRKALALIQVTAPWSNGDAAGEKRARAWMTSISAALTTGMKQKRAAYVNYLYSGIQSWQSAYFDVNYRRLQGVKSKYDPQNFFRFAQSIAPLKSQKCQYKPCT